MGKQRISAVEDVGHSVQLMLTELDFRVHTAERDVTSIIFPGTSGVEKLIVPCNKFTPPVRVPPNPVLKRIFDGLLFLLCEGCLLGVEHTALFSIRIGHGVIDADVP